MEARRRRMGEGNFCFVDLKFVGEIGWEEIATSGEGEVARVGGVEVVANSAEGVMGDGLISGNELADHARREAGAVGEGSLLPIE